MNLSLSAVEIRALGALMEKELATPDYYPLSLSALTNACNQKSSRDPVMSLPEADVRDAMDSLISQGLARERSPAGSRVGKFSHRLDDSLGLSFGLTRDERCVLCVLMLRGPQTIGELRGRGERLRGTEGSDDVGAVLEGLRDRERGPWVRELAREPGRREARWTHLLGGDAPPESSESRREEAPPASATTRPTGSDGRVERLEREVSELRAEIAALRARLDGILEGEPGQSD